MVNVEGLTRKRVLAIGLGCMGQPVVTQLIRHGVATQAPGRMHIVDGDVVSSRNLIGTDYRVAHIGQPKTAAVTSMLAEINPEAIVTWWNRRLTDRDLIQVADLARQADLVGLFADSFDLMLTIADRCAPFCPLVMAALGPEADYAEVAFSRPGLTPPLRKIMGNRPRQRIASPSALGCDTLYVASFVAAVCLELLLAPADQGKLVRCHPRAPLFVLGLRKAWIFENQPADIARIVHCVQGTT